MQSHARKILKKINLLNHAVKASLLEDNGSAIVKNFTEATIIILGADFGFAWGRFSENETFRLIYKSAKAPNEPSIPVRKKGAGIENKLFDTDVRKENYVSGNKLGLRSYMIIPINYGDHVYGSIVVGYKKKHLFAEIDFELVSTIGYAAAQAVNTYWMVQKEHKDLALVEKHKEIQTLLGQEKLKMEFISNATHEFRTPLAIMKGNVDLALGKKLKSSRSALQAINNEINHLSTILEDLSVLISPKKQAKDTLRMEKINLTDLLKEVAKRVRTLSVKKNISINIKRSKPFFMTGDKKYMEKLFLNLFKNAVTYGRNKGKIVVDIKEDGKERSKCASVRVQDNGIGISEKDLPHIFERFFRADKSHSSRGKHSGLGLAISKWIAEIHNGTIEAKSIYGKGTTFIINLPCE